MEEDHQEIIIMEAHLPAGITIQTEAAKAVTDNKLRKGLHILLQEVQAAAHPVLIRVAIVEEVIAAQVVKAEAVPAVVAAAEAIPAAEEEDNKYYEKLFT